MGLEFMTPKEFVECLACREEESEGCYRVLRECVCQNYRNAVVAEAELRGLHEHPVLAQLVKDY